MPAGESRTPPWGTRARREDDDTTKVTVGPNATVARRPRAEQRRASILVVAGPGVGAMVPITKDETVIGRGRECDLQIDDVGISRRHARIVRGGEGKLLIEDLGSTNGTFLGEQPATRTALDDGDRIRLGRTTILKFTMHDNVEEEYQKQLYESVVRDPLTQLYNRRHFGERLKTEFAFAERHQTPLAVLLLDLDHFKQVNDTRGHLAGDHVLRTVASAIARMVRAEDVVARYGGEEFVLIVRGVDDAAVRALSERVRSTIERLAVEWDGKRIPVTASVGFVTMDGGVTFANGEALVATADANLYKAKEAGRNRVVG